MNGDGECLVIMACIGLGHHAEYMYLDMMSDFMELNTDTSKNVCMYVCM
jgi:hypothetical protein